MSEPGSSSTAAKPRLPSELLRPWWAFTADPQDDTASDLAQALKTLQAADAGLAAEAMRIIAADLARRPARDRCSMTTVLTFWLIDATGFLKATAGIKLAHPTMEQPKPGESAEHLDPARARKKRVPADSRAAEPKPRSKSSRVRRELLAGLDLAGADGRAVDIAGLEQRVNDADDATSIRHLEKTLNLLESLVVEGAGYSEARRGELTSTLGTTQGHMARQMGFRAAPSGARTGRDALGALEAQNAMAAPYWRTDFRKRLDDFLKALPEPLPLGRGQILVNSPNVLRKLMIVLPPEVLKGLTVQPLRGESGISVLSGVDFGADSKGAEAGLTEQIFNEIGASPSAYQLYELLDVGKQPPPADFEIDTHAALAQLITSSRFSRLQEIAAGRSGLAPVCATAEQLILTLTHGPGPDRHDALTASAIASLTELVDLVVVSPHTPAVALRAVDLMIDEIGVILAVAKNYLWSDYSKAVRAILIERAPSIGQRIDVDIDVSSHLLSSAMDALATALWVALSTRGHQQVDRPTEPVDYFETSLLLSKLKKGETVTPHKDVLIAALNPSTPWVAPEPAQLVRDVLKGLEARTAEDEPFALILDTTIQVPPRGDKPSQLDIVLGSLSDAIGTGALEVFLCKSFQKYATLGFGKVAAGDLTLLSKKGNLASAPARHEVLQHEFALDLNRHDEAQLLVHILKHAHRHELTLIAAAAANTRFVDHFCWPTFGNGVLGTSYVGGIPLLLRSTTSKLSTVIHRFPALESRSSFSFLRTSYTPDIDLPRGPGGATVNYVRFNTGHESRAAMTEIFYGLGHLAVGLLPGAVEPPAPGSRVDLGDLPIEAVMKHLAVLESATQPPDEGQEIPGALAELRRYRNNIIASYCLCAGLVRGRPDWKVGLLVDFFNENLENVTADTLRALAETFLRQLVILNKKVGGGDLRMFTAVCRATALLPSWQFPAEALRIDLGGLDESPPAIRLRKLVGRAEKANKRKSQKKVKTKTT